MCQEQHVWSYWCGPLDEQLDLYPQRSPWVGGTLACAGFSGKAITWRLMGECPDVSGLLVSQVVSVCGRERKSRVQCLVGTGTRTLKFGKRSWAHRLPQWLRLGLCFEGWPEGLELGKRGRGSGPAGGHWVHAPLVYSSW